MFRDQAYCLINKCCREKRVVYKRISLVRPFGNILFGQFALAVLDCYLLKDRIPEKAIDILTHGALGEIPETPKAGNPIFDKIENIIISSIKDALQIAEREARTQGYSPVILSASLKGEARKAQWLALQAMEAHHESEPTTPIRY